jgi:hypothetical protein
MDNSSSTSVTNDSSQASPHESVPNPNTPASSIVNKIAGSLNGFLSTNRTNQEVLRGSANISSLSSQSPTVVPAPLLGPTPTMTKPAPSFEATSMKTELANLSRVLEQVEVKQFPLQGEFSCRKVLQLYGSINVLEEISFYVITTNQTDRLWEVIGMVIDISNSVSSDSDNFGSIMDQIRLILRSDIAKNPKVLVLHKVAINGLLVEDWLPNPEMLYLHRVSLLKKELRGHCIYFGNALKELYISLDKMVDEPTSFFLPQGLKRMNAYFDKTERLSCPERPLWFCAYDIVSLNQM